MPENSPYIPGEKRKGDSLNGDSYQINAQFSSWEVGTKYTVQRVLGKGSYGQVALAIDRFHLNHGVFIIHATELALISCYM